MKKYCVPSLILILVSTLLFGLGLPFFVTLCTHRTNRSETCLFEKEGFFIAHHEPYILIEDAFQQAPQIAVARGISLEQLHKLIEKNTQEWPFYIFPTYVDVRVLNRALLQVDSQNLQKKV